MFEYIIASELNPRNVYSLHQLVMVHFSTGGDLLHGRSVRPIWRSMPVTGGCSLLVRSVNRPLSTHPPISEVNFTFSRGQQMQFYVRLSLSKRINVTGSSGYTVRKKEVAVSREEIGPWLSNMLQKNGFRMSNCSLLSACRIKTPKGFHINAGDIVFNATVIDEDMAHCAYSNGIGRQKAFGFGLLLKG